MERKSVVLTKMCILFALCYNVDARTARRRETQDSGSIVDDFVWEVMVWNMKVEFVVRQWNVHLTCCRSWSAALIINVNSVICSEI